MNKLIITLEAISEFHEPKPYEYYAAIRVVGVDAAHPLVEIIHRCEDVKDGIAYSTPDEAKAIAEIYLSANCRIVGQEIIAKIGE